MSCQTKILLRKDVGKGKLIPNRKNFKAPLNIAPLNRSSTVAKQKRKLTEDVAVGNETTHLMSKVPVPVVSRISNCKCADKMKVNENKTKIKCTITNTISAQLNTSEGLYQDKDKFKSIEKKAVGLNSEKDRSKIPVNDTTQTAALLPSKGILKRKKWNSSYENLNFAKENWDSDLKKKNIFTEKHLATRKVTFQSAENLHFSDENSKFSDAAIYLKKINSEEVIIVNENILENNKCNLDEEQKYLGIRFENQNAKNIATNEKIPLKTSSPEKTKPSKILCDKSLQTSTVQFHETGVQYSPPTRRKVTKEAIQKEINDKVKFLTAKFLKEIKERKKKNRRQMASKNDKPNNSDRQMIANQDKEKSENQEKDRPEERIIKSQNFSYNENNCLIRKINSIKVTTDEKTPRDINKSPSRIPRPFSSKNKKNYSSHIDLNFDKTQYEKKTGSNFSLHQNLQKNENSQITNSDTDNQIFCESELLREVAERAKGSDISKPQIGKTLRENIQGIVTEKYKEGSMSKEVKLQDITNNKKSHGSNGFNITSSELKFSHQNKDIEDLENEMDIKFTRLKKENDELIKYLQTSFNPDMFCLVSGKPMNENHMHKNIQENEASSDTQKSFFTRNRKLLGGLLIILCCFVLFQTFL